MKSVTIHQGDSREVLKALPDNSIDSVVTDPPYALVSIVKRWGGKNATPAKSEGASGVYKRASAGFMGQTWDTGETAFDPDFWVEVMRVLKPGGHLIAASGTRTYHRLAVAIEDAGFEVRDMISWLYGSGFPKSHDVAKGIDARLIAGSGRTEDMRRIAMGDDYQPSGRGRVNFDHGGGSAMNGATGKGAITAEAGEWEGWGTALKPACEPWVLARKPLDGTVAANVLAHGTGALNIDGCRIETDEDRRRPSAGGDNGLSGSGTFKIRERRVEEQSETSGRWPANVVHDGSEEVVEAFPAAPGQSGSVTGQEPSTNNRSGYAGLAGLAGRHDVRAPRGDEGSAARFFYSAKADADDRLGSKHPTVKPIDLMRYLCRLVTPPGGVVLDPFAGSGSTGVAAMLEGFESILIEREAAYVADIKRKVAFYRGEGRLAAQERGKVKNDDASDLPLFGGAAA